MAFFFILPLWLLLIIGGIVLICIRSARRFGIYLVVTSTSATTISFVLSTAVLFIAPRIVDRPPSWFAILTIGAYVGAIPIGGVIGAVAGILLTKKLLPAVARA
jgi:hypothetical protein